MSDYEYISIKAFAVRAGVSVQAIYKRLSQVDNQLNDYVKSVDGKRMLNVQALQDIYGIEVGSKNQSVEQPVVNGYQSFIDCLKEQIDQDRRDMQLKDEQIKFLQDQLIQLDLRHHAEMQSMQELLNQEQKLHILSIQRIKELEGDSEVANHKSVWQSIVDFFRR